MDPLQLLKKQHREVEGLFKKALKAEGASERKHLMQQIAHDLELHTKIEEDVFYPAIRAIEAKKAEEMVLEAYEEHHVVKLVLKELPGVDPEDERFHAKMTVLKELVKHHVEEEEKEMFKLAKKLDDDEMERIGEEMLSTVEASGKQTDRRRAA